jgi:hypothetical protein
VRRTRFLLGTAAAVVIMALASAACAETFSLPLKRLTQEDLSRLDDRYWTSPQNFSFQTVADEKNRVDSLEDAGQAVAFKRIVKKEPKYKSARPFRGVARLGAREYAFVLDTAPLKEVPKPNPLTDKAGTEGKPGSLLASGLIALREALAPPPKVPQYTRLYFDLNHNGDLTDDTPIKAEADLEALPAGENIPIRFPRVDLTLDIDGAKQEYSFSLWGNVMTSPQISYAWLSLRAAVCREGDITLEGKRHHVILLDFNSNGRFDDAIEISKSISDSDAQLYPEQGDILLIDPTDAGDSPFDIASPYRHYVSKLLNLDGRFYQLKVSPRGDKLTLSPVKLALGRVTNPNGAFNAVVYGDQGFLKISGSPGAPATLPEGQWKLAAYKLIRSEVPAASKPGEKAAATGVPCKPVSLLGALMESIFGRRTFVAVERSGPQESVVEAQGTAQYKPVTVRKGQTVVMPFGPPYKPVVTAEPVVEGPMQLVGKPAGPPTSLEMSLRLVGSCGEVCGDMTVRGDRPPKPEFTITDAKGKFVQQGRFEYG